MSTTETSTPPFDPDPDYDQTAPIAKHRAKRGRQCGQCGLKIEYGITYGYCCPTLGCPMNWGPGT